MLLSRVRRFEAHCGGNLGARRRHAVVDDRVLDHLEDLALARREVGHAHAYSAVRIISFVLIYRNARGNNSECEADHIGRFLTEARAPAPSVPAVVPLVGAHWSPFGPWIQSAPM